MKFAKIYAVLFLPGMLVGCANTSFASKEIAAPAPFNAKDAVTIQSLLDADFEILHPQENSFLMRRDNYLYRCRIKVFPEEQNVCRRIQ